MRSCTRYYLLLCVALGACAGLPPAPRSPAQAVFELETVYGAALSTAVAYGTLPPCVPGVQALCADPYLVGKIQVADLVAWSALNAAQMGVRSEGSAELSVARAAVAALVAVVAETQHPVEISQ